jgi:hypothetical protein
MFYRQSFSFTDIPDYMQASPTLVNLLLVLVSSSHSVPVQSRVIEIFKTKNKYTNLYTLGSPEPRDRFRFTHDTSQVKRLYT